MRGATVVAVYGSSEPVAGSADYETARRLGSLLAAAGFTVLTGGYGGVMEAAARGAREAGGRNVGITCEAFSGRSPNRWLDEVVPAADLLLRTRELIDRAQGYVVLPGKAGTLAELALLWALDRAGCLGPRPVVLLGDRWGAVLRSLRENHVLEVSQIRRSHLVSDPSQALAVLRAALDRDGRP